jgi:hypothetical protein
MERLEFLERRLSQLGERIEALEQNVGDLCFFTRHPVEKLLWQLGFPVINHGDGAQLLFPHAIGDRALSRFYSMMKRYSFRLFMRELIQEPEGEDFCALSRYCSPKTVRSYLETLAALEMVALSARGYRLLRKVPSFGPTLEWFVCELLRREFLSPALFNVKLKNTRHGGDFDVVSLLAGRLVYVEVKSSPPRGVEHQAVEAFLARFEDLGPSLAVFLVDTELRMKDKLVPLFDGALERQAKTDSSWAMQRLVDEIFHVRHCIYVTNSRKGIYSNFRTCFRDFYANLG